MEIEETGGINPQMKKEEGINPSQAKVDNSGNASKTGKQGGFGDFVDFGFSSGLTGKIAESFNEMLKAKGVDVKVTPFEKSRYPGHAYDNILLSISNGEIAYGFVIVVGESGQGPVSLSTFISAAERRQPVWLMTKTLENTLVNTMKMTIGSQKLIITGGIAWMPGVEATGPILANILGKAVNSLYEEAGIIKPNTLSPQLQYALNMSPCSQPIINQFGTPKATSWIASIVAERNDNVQNPNMQGTSGNLIEVSGVVDLLTLRQSTPSQQGPVDTAVTSPLIVMNRVGSEGAQKQGVGQALLGIFATAIVASRANYVLPLLESPYNVGALEKHYGAKPIKLNDNTVPIDKKQAVINKLVTGPAMIAIAVDDLSLEGGPMSKFVTAGIGDAASSKAIVAEAHRITNGIFPENFPINDVVQTVVALPAGTYKDNNGTVQDLGGLNQAFFLNSDPKNGVVNAFRYCQIISGEVPDSFSAMVSLLNDTLVPTSVELIGSKALVYLNGKFVHELIISLDKAGLKPQFTDMLQPLNSAQLASGGNLGGAFIQSDGISQSAGGPNVTYSQGNGFAVGGAYYKYNQ